LRARRETGDPRVGHVDCAEQPGRCQPLLFNFQSVPLPFSV
jgi:hypothetical protein